MTINLTLPLHNEARTVAHQVGTLDAFLAAKPYAKELFLVLSDNASTDATRTACEELVRKNRIRTMYHFTPTRGKGAGIAAGWKAYRADQYWYMDVDLATDLAAVDDLHAKLQHADVVIGSRLLPASRVQRRLVREITSRGYNFLLRHLFEPRFHDAQCGFKGITHRVAETVLPLTRHQGYFFDTELLLIAQAQGYEIVELPVTWREGPRSHVVLRRAVPYFLRSLYLHHRRTRREPYSLHRTST